MTTTGYPTGYACARNPEQAHMCVRDHLVADRDIHTVDAAIIDAYDRIALRTGAKDYTSVWCSNGTGACMQLTTIHDPDWLAQYSLVDLYLQGDITPATGLSE